VKLKGIASSKRRYAAHLQKLERERLGETPADDGGLNPRWHRPAPGSDSSTLRCSCSAMPFSLAAYAEHVAGNQNLEVASGVYVTGLMDPLALELERKAREVVAAPAEQPDPMLMRDEHGDTWQPFINSWSQRQMRNLRTGEIKHAPVYIVREEKQQHQAGGFNDAGTIFE
jgi:hypothetical protein